MVLILIAYYIVDWHDLNHVAYSDDKIGMSQMTLWMICIFVLTLSAVLYISALSMTSMDDWRRHILTVAALAAVYIPWTFIKRNELIELSLDDESVSPKKAFKEGVEKGLASARSQRNWVLTRGGAAIITLGSWFIIYRSYDHKDRSCDIAIGIVSVMAWAAAFCFKLARSIKKIGPDYRKAIEKILALSVRCYERSSCKE